jgi:hypothetical protein
MLGAYHLPDAGSPLAAMGDRRQARLRAAWPRWKAGRHPKGGSIVVPIGLSEADTMNPADYGAPEPCSDGLVWLPPRVMPTLYDLAREDPPRETATIRLRRVGPVTVPLGMGPCFGLGPHRGKPSSEFGTLAHEQYRRARDAEYVWTDEDEAAVERLVFLAFQFGYCVTWEIWCRLAPYDLDEVAPILDGIWGLDPKASRDVGPTSPPSRPG